MYFIQLIVMKTSLLALFVLLSGFCPGLVEARQEPLEFSPASVEEPTEVMPALQLIERVTPGYASQFILEIIPAEEDGTDVYEVDAKEGKVCLRGNNIISLATAYNWYLKYTCNAHLSWFGDQLELPEKLPLPTSKERRRIEGKYRVYMNYCTVNYSASWWNWKRWQREIDYMAMNSINMPLFVTGLEGVWYNTLFRFGFTDEETRKFLVGPSYFAWQWMQNIEGVGGPLPKSWIDSHVELGQQILARELELGMTPIQQGFSGYVPRALKEKYPEAKIKFQHSWCGFPGAAQLDPTDPLFKELGKVFLEEERELFGGHGYYAADPFHESSPPDKSPEYLTNVGKGIHTLIKEHDPNAVWVMQAWSLYENIIKAVPLTDLLILDLNGTKRGKHNFWGYPFVSGNLHNFGGRINLHGDLPLIASNQYATARKSAPNAVGSGLFMEAIEQNPVYYELTFEMPNHEGAVELKQWLGKYAERRYGAPSESAAQAWEKLLEGPYRKGTNGTENSSIICARPALNVKKSGPNSGFNIPYPPLLLIEAQDLLLKDMDKLKGSKPYRFDLVDVQRQILSNLGQVVHRKAAEAFEKGNKEEFNLHSARFLALLKDVDVLLRTRPEFNFDKWLADARAWGTTEEERNFYERNATALVTIWGEGTNGDPLIFDYSWREWAGLIEGYYLPRWKMFYDMLRKNLEAGTPYSEKGVKMTHGREAFRANDFYKELGDWELKYVATYNKGRTPVTEGHDITVVQNLVKKYAPMYAEYYASNNKADKQKDEEKFENLGEKAQG